MSRWVHTVLDRIRQSLLVRLPQKMATSVKWMPLVKPSPLVIALEDLAPVWLRHNQDFRSAHGSGLRPIGTPAVTMEEALAPAGATVVSAILRGREGVASPGKEPVVVSAVPAVVAPRTPITKRAASSILLRDFILPYQGLLERQQVLGPLVTMIDVLEEYGDCPSVVLEAKTQDEEVADLYSIRDTLAQVNLRDHTHRVTKHGLAELMSHYKDPEPLIPKMLMSCLGHDLGKIPVFRASGIYSMRDHPAISVMKIREYCEKVEIFWIDEVCEAIQGHHRLVKDAFATLLKVADGRAREEEVAYVTKTLEIKRWDDWFTTSEFLALLEPLINMGGTDSTKKGEWAAVASGGIVYCQTRALYGVVKELARQKKIVDIHLLRMSDRDQVLNQLAVALGTAGVLAESIGEGFSGRRYKLRLKTKKELPIYAVPILESAFATTPSSMEQRKTGFFKLIEDIVH